MVTGRGGGLISFMLCEIMHWVVQYMQNIYIVFRKKNKSTYLHSLIKVDRVIYPPAFRFISVLVTFPQWDARTKSRKIPHCLIPRAIYYEDKNCIIRPTVHRNIFFNKA